MSSFEDNSFENNDYRKKSSIMVETYQATISGSTQQRPTPDLQIRPREKKNLDKGKNGDILVTMTILEMLRTLVNEKGLRKVARELGIDHASLYRSLNSDLRLSTIQAIADLFGYDLELVKRKEVKPINSNPSSSRRN